MTDRISVDKWRQMMDEANADTPKHRRNDDPEFKLQKQCVQWFKHQYPFFKISSSLNGIYIRDKGLLYKIFEANIIEKGYPDVEILAPRGYMKHPMKASVVNTLFIELKNGKIGKQSEPQKRFEEYCKKMKCYEYHLVRTFEEFVKIVEDYLYGR